MNVKFRNYLEWSESSTFLNNALTEKQLHAWLTKQLPYIVEIHDDGLDLRAVGKFVNCKWSAYLCNNLEDVIYFFEDEIEATAFKLKFL